MKFFKIPEGYPLRLIGIHSIIDIHPVDSDRSRDSIRLLDSNRTAGE